MIRSRITILNLKENEFMSFGLCRSPEYKGQGAVKYKSAIRKEIEREGYRIWGNVGDQWSDLQGECSGKRTFKLPNPMYFISWNHPSVKVVFALLLSQLIKEACVLQYWVFKTNTRILVSIFTLYFPPPTTFYHLHNLVNGYFRLVLEKPVLAQLMVMSSYLKCSCLLSKQLKLIGNNNIKDEKKWL